MDEAALHDRLARIERRLNAVLGVVVAGILFLAAELVGYWTMGAVTVLGAVTALALVAVRRRAGSSQAGA